MKRSASSSRCTLPPGPSHEFQCCAHRAQPIPSQGSVGLRNCNRIVVRLSTHYYVFFNPRFLNPLSEFSAAPVAVEEGELSLPQLSTSHRQPEVHDIPPPCVVDCGNLSYSRGPLSRLARTSTTHTYRHSTSHVVWQRGRYIRQEAQTAPRLRPLPPKEKCVRH